MSNTIDLASNRRYLSNLETKITFFFLHKWIMQDNSERAVQWPLIISITSLQSVSIMALWTPKTP